ncbi:MULTISPECIES: SDR family oxidoreductase [Actinosynnema]|uniref:SDR family NAD(P)-dependent oxidoreductase n=1 Tax=Actinosynnema TaxID=40566 RepID=UPI0020A35D4E|nr:SDR family NAD(P)-dependent oxidoreductase [Actinosynnema pretiosum]MCP2092484.1 Short-chain dehydrogenase [Actinosynnema pretiosum]
MRSAVVTGAAGGLGERIAARLAGRGYAVVVADVDEVGARAVARAVGRGARAVELDVGDPGACERVAAGAPDLAVWVNGAGLLSAGPAWEEPWARRRALLSVNAEGVVNGTLAALGVMGDDGHVVNVVSLAGLVAAPGEALYSASKHAALAFSVGVQHDLRLAGRGARVSALCPDGMWTPMLFDRASDPRAAASWFGTLLHPDEVADAAVGLLDRPRPVLAVPRWRGPLVRLLAAFPGLGMRASGPIMAVARRKQRRFAKRVL